MQNKQVIENRYSLRGKEGVDTGIVLPEGPVIWAINHGFKDDALGTVLIARHSYILFASLPMFFNTFDGVLAYLNGIVLMNRKDAHAKRGAICNAMEVLRLGADFIIYPEGVWNKTPDKLLLPLWPGVYRIAVESGCPVVPVVHYLRDAHSKAKDNLIHTVIDDPIDMTSFSEEQGLRHLRDVMATWYYLMMERYGQSTRAEVLEGQKNVDEAWEAYLKNHIGAVPYYDVEIETMSDYRPKTIARPEDVFAPIAGIQKADARIAKSVLYARGLVEQERRRDFQRRF